ncbi:MAG: DNRLRE domain-containing protein [Planctomycetota bacterium]|nr:DNRLRE domain-containing protein [Planctomycetota bacterium]
MKSPAVRLTFGLLTLLACALRPAHADVATCQATKDATIYNDTVGNRADGKSWNLYAGQAGTNTTWPTRRALVAFDLSAIPAGATVTNVQVKLFMSKTVVGAKDFALHRLTKSWNEGPSVGLSGNGTAAQTGDSTWLHTNYATQFWTNPGGDFVTPASATLSIGSTYQYYVWGSNAALVADVQGWVNNPANNFGWILRGPEGGPKSAKQFESRESLPNYRPVLVVTYTPPGPQVYCTAKVNSLGCTPSIGFSGVPDINAGSGFPITLGNTLNQKAGLLFYGTFGPTSTAFQGGTLCVQAPFFRTGAQSSGGTPSPAADCSGTFAYDFNVLLAAGSNPSLQVGTLVCAQFWSRDPAATFTTNLSNALRFTVQP